MMTRQRVTSSNIASIGYDSSTSTLEIEFNTGSIYEYSNVSSNINAALMSASSHGTYFNANIKGRYSFRQIK